MGGNQSLARYLTYGFKISDEREDDVERIMLLRLQGKIQNIPMELISAHFTPSNFPLYPIISKRNAAICTESWKKVMSAEYMDEKGIVSAGMTMFYNDFYERLGSYDAAGHFETVFEKNSHGKNKIAFKGGLIIRVVQGLLTIDEDSPRIALYLAKLGESHAKKCIRPWQYAIFVQCILLSIASRLGSQARGDVMEAWVHLFAFALKSMMPIALKGNVLLDEMNVNYSAEEIKQKKKDKLQEAALKSEKEANSKLAVNSVKPGTASKAKSTDRVPK